MKLNSRSSVISTAIILILIISACGTSDYPQGQRLYNSYCANCHMEDGKGLENLIPPLASADYLTDHQSDLPCIILQGQNGNIIVNGIHYNQEMPGEKFTEVQINNIINYINTAWGNKIPTVSIADTKKRIDACFEK